MKLWRRFFGPLTTYFDVFRLSPTYYAIAMAPPPSKTKTSVRVATYNVLSSHLSDPWHFSTLDPDHLSAKNRLPAVIKQLDDEISSSSLICLQEVSHDWAGKFHTHFAQNGYNFIYGPYGKPFNGYFGVGIAYSTNDYQVVDVDIARLADKREGGWPRPPKDPNVDNEGIIKKTWKSCTNVASSVVTKVVRPYLEKINLIERVPVDHWKMSSQRWNILITLKLEDTTTKQQFAVSTYHMPCAYYAPMVMTIHVDLAARYVQKLCSFSGSKGNENGSSNDNDDKIPYILAGDWNIKPDSSSYRLMTTGQMDRGDPEWPTPKYGVEWEPTAEPMRSAYAVIDKDGKEPDFTNYARIKEQEPFIETLDYIFVSSEWNVKQVKPLKSRDEAGGPFPNLDRNEPSDHVLIATDLEL
mmetsp:Transcript_49693/g.120468  ORF Transcript_49693/g.120468 Transcript_49693/m.120468 type:complete len:411 (-) Transcript_49693:1330-2562(-)